MITANGAGQASGPAAVVVVAVGGGGVAVLLVIYSQVPPYHSRPELVLHTCSGRGAATVASSAWHKTVALGCSATMPEVGSMETGVWSAEQGNEEDGS